jgi:hypothetical protein
LLLLRSSLTSRQKHKVRHVSISDIGSCLTLCRNTHIALAGCWSRNEGSEKGSIMSPELVSVQTSIYAHYLTCSCSRSVVSPGPVLLQDYNPQREARRFLAMMAVTGFFYYKKFTIVVDVDGERVTAYEEVRKGPTYLMDAQEIVEGRQARSTGARTHRRRASEDAAHPAPTMRLRRELASGRSCDCSHYRTDGLTTGRNGSGARCLYIDTAPSAFLKPCLLVVPMCLTVATSN